ncbi:TPR domain protein [Aphelenchoides avenae]|nr:TPR domain protein [Aphelenchus avenae]
MVIKEPYMKFGSSGDTCFMRVDSPTDIIIVNKHDKKTLGQFGALKWYEDEHLTFDQLKAKGNKCFVGKDYHGALNFYQRALTLRSDQDSETAVIHLNRSAAFLGLEQFPEAFDSAQLALDGGKREKAMYR